MTGGSVTGGGIASGAGIHAHSAGGFAIDVVVSRSTIRGGNNNTPPSQGFGFVGQGVLASGSTAAAPVSFEIIGSSSDAVIGGSGTSSTGVAIYSNLNTPVRVHGPVVVASFVGPVSFLPSLPAVTVSGALHADGELDAAQAVSVTVGSAQANGLFALLFDTRPGFTSVPALTDERLLLSPSAQFVALGVLDSAGGYGTSFVPVTQAPLVVGVPMHWQAFTWGSTTGRWLGSNLEQRRCRL
jgi:hypothetical protein